MHMNLSPPVLLRRVVSQLMTVHTHVAVCGERLRKYSVLCCGHHLLLWFGGSDCTAGLLVALQHILKTLYNII
jgi:hypothetical protein